MSGIASLGFVLVALLAGSEALSLVDAEDSLGSARLASSLFGGPALDHPDTFNRDIARNEQLQREVGARWARSRGRVGEGRSHYGAREGEREIRFQVRMPRSETVRASTQCLCSSPVLPHAGCCC